MTGLNQPIGALEERYEDYNKDYMGDLREKEELYFLPHHSDYLGLPEVQLDLSNKDYADRIGGGLSGNGLRHDLHESSRQVLDILHGDGSEEAMNLMHLYTHHRAAQKPPERQKHKVPRNVESISYDEPDLGYNIRSVYTSNRGPDVSRQRSHPLTLVV